MSSEGRGKLNQQISEEAAEWLVEFRTGDIDSSGREAFDAWIRTSPEHLRAFIEMAALWDQSGQVDARKLFDIDTLIARSHAAGNVIPLASGQPAVAAPSAGSGGKRRAVWAAAAAVTGLLCAGSIAWYLLVGQSTYVTDVGEQRSIRLADGSTVTLNSRSRLRVEFTDTRRTIELLAGQAMFRVATSPGRPFIVHADGTTVEAVGTQFDVNRSREGTIVTVVEGRVAVVAGDEEPPAVHTTDVPTAAVPGSANVRAAVLLSAGEQVKVDTKAVGEPEHANVSSATAWTQGQLVLESATLEQVADEFNRYSARKLVAEDHGANPLHLSGVFATDPDFLIHYLQSRPDIVVRETATQIVIVRNGPK